MRQQYFLNKEKQRKHSLCLVHDEYSWRSGDGYT